ncbi:uncharacterized protein RCC_01280 [Ramularia collo-cygni]|uniref:F-box domain-containing protein n=1 Tax=Ramularia collo-cygni TaxID=112498 RepID=A0A2D3UMK6_9PEZI|nr:uncharacterized protein RCC_01280 [Ramularia collo-cygni]CZT15421.1 uncharacterized protein RCC_01280 [Ramularia collo-cygni]
MSATINPQKLDGEPMTLLRLPQELLDMIIEATFKDTTVTLNRDNLRPRSPDDLVSERNAGLLLTCKTLYKHAKEPYYKLSKFEALAATDLRHWLATLKRNGVAERSLITSLDCSFSSALEAHFDGWPFCIRFHQIKDHSKLMCLLMETQDYLDKLTQRLMAEDYDVGLDALRGSAEYLGYGIRDVIPTQMSITW